MLLSPTDPVHTYTFSSGPLPQLPHAIQSSSPVTLPTRAYVMSILHESDACSIAIPLDFHVRTHAQARLTFQDSIDSDSMWECGTRDGGLATVLLRDPIFPDDSRSGFELFRTDCSVRTAPMLCPIQSERLCASLAYGMLWIATALRCRGYLEKASSLKALEANNQKQLEFGWIVFSVYRHLAAFSMSFRSI